MKRTMRRSGTVSGGSGWLGCWSPGNAAANGLFVAKPGCPSPAVRDGVAVHHHHIVARRIRLPIRRDLLATRVAHGERGYEARLDAAGAWQIGGAQQRRRRGVTGRIVHDAVGMVADDELARPGVGARRDEGQPPQQHRRKAVIARQQRADRVGLERVDELLGLDDGGPGEVVGMVGEEVRMRRSGTVATRPVDHGRLVAEARAGDRRGGAVVAALVVPAGNDPRRSADGRQSIRECGVPRPGTRHKRRSYP